MVKHARLKLFLRVLISVLFLVALAIASTWFIYYRQYMAELDPTWEFINDKPALFWYSAFIMLLMLCALAAVLWQPFLAGGIYFACVSVITYVHMQKYALRAAPLLPEDFQLAASAGNLISFVDPWSIVRVVAGAVLVIFGSAVLQRCANRVFDIRTQEERQALPWWQRFAVIPRASFTMIALTALALSTDFVINRSGSGSSSTSWLGADFVAWNQTENYQKNGFILSFLYNLGTTDVKEPEDYSAEKIAAVMEKYQLQSKAESNKQSLADTVDNVVIVLAETFFDPDLLTKYYPYDGDDDVIPNVHRVFTEYPSGYMYSPEYGGNTANIEFEVLSGLSNYWAQTIPYSSVISKLDSLDTIASFAKELDFETTAIHSYDGAMYKRNINYPKMGLETFIDQDKMEHLEYEEESDFINDRAVYQEILDILKDNDQPQLINAVTMQNHVPYCSANYTERRFWLTNGDDVPSPWMFACLYQSLYKSDEYLGEFLSELDELDEKTVVLWFGDHTAGVLDEYVGSDAKNDRDMAHFTPYFVYSNFELPVETDAKTAQASNKRLGFDFRNTRGIDLPTTTPNCLSNTLYNLLDVQKPALMYLLDEVCEETPVLARVYFGNEEPEETEALKDYELINYDIQSGEHYFASELKKKR